ncbi:Alpha/Beta hydrolase protein [Coprinopsis sp. MPI-PUGE-AT-0042]|nr:Alpha/Beta hydrolase protein [Coprinopsis sp. MPI-PUGE-AT-0042]
MTGRLLTSSDGALVYAEAFGDSSKPPIVFIHGFALSAGVWEALFREPSLRDHFYLVAYDLRGHGRSAKPTSPEGYESTLFASDFKAVLEAFSIKKPIVLGWSMGGAVLADILGNLPEGTVSGLIYLNAVPGTNAATGNFRRQEFIDADVSLKLVSSDADTNCNARIEFVDACFNSPGPDQAKKWEWVGMGCMQPPSIAILFGTRKNDDTKLVEAARNGLPTLYLYGTADKIYDTVAMESCYRERFSALDIHGVEGGSHSPMADESVSEVGTAIAKFASKTFAT